MATLTVKIGHLYNYSGQWLWVFFGTPCTNSAVYAAVMDLMINQSMTTMRWESCDRFSAVVG